MPLLSCLFQWPRGGLWAGLGTDAGRPRNPLWRTAAAYPPVGLIPRKESPVQRKILIPMLLLLAIVGCGQGGGGGQTSSSPSPAPNTSSSPSPAPNMQATTFHVATTGSDANNGSAGAPWLTIGKCVSAMQGGDTCLVHAGTYAESTLYLPNGTSGAPTTLQANPGDTVTINSPSRTNDCMICFHLGAQWQVVDGFILDGLALTKFIVNTDDNSQSDFHHLTIQNCEMRNSLYSGMLISGDNWKVLGNNIHHNGTDATLDHGIYFSASQSLIQ